MAEKVNRRRGRDKQRWCLVEDGSVEKNQQKSSRIPWSTICGENIRPVLFGRQMIVTNTKHSFTSWYYWCKKLHEHGNRMPSITSCCCKPSDNHYRNRSSCKINETLPFMWHTLKRHVYVEHDEQCTYRIISYVNFGTLVWMWFTITRVRDLYTSVLPVGVVVCSATLKLKFTNVTMIITSCV